MNATPIVVLAVAVQLVAAVVALRMTGLAGLVGVADLFRERREAEGRVERRRSEGEEHGPPL